MTTIRVRDPKGWYASAHKHSPEYGDLHEAIRLWSASASAMIAARQQYGDCVYLMSFEALVGNTEIVMRSLANFLGIEFAPSLLNPTFNRLPMKANSTYRMREYGVLQDAVLRYRTLLSVDQINYLDGEPWELYEQALQQVNGCREATPT